MTQFKAIEIVPDYVLMAGMEEKQVTEMVHSKLAYSLSKALLESEEFRQLIILRDKPRFGYEPNGTTFELAVNVLTPAEAEEFAEFQKIKKSMKKILG